MDDHHSNNLQALAKISTKRDMAEAIECCRVDAVDAEILRRRYICRQDFGFIADSVGLSYSATVRRHKRAISMLVNILPLGAQNTNK